MIITSAEKEDLGQILELQKLAFRAQAEIYNDFSIPPLIQTLEDIEQDILTQTYLKAVINKKIIGSVRGYESNKTCYIGRLIVHPAYQNQGYGKAIVNQIINFVQEKGDVLYLETQNEANIKYYHHLGLYTISSKSLPEPYAHFSMYFLGKEFSV